MLSDITSKDYVTLKKTKTADRRVHHKLATRQKTKKEEKRKRTGRDRPIETESMTVFGTSIPDRIGHQMIVQVPTSLNLFLHYLQKNKTSEIWFEMKQKRQ